MRDEGEDLRRVGRDEMNLAEYPITLLADRVPEGCKTLVFEGRHGRLTVSGSDAYGLPIGLDNDMIVGLIQLTKLRNDFTDLFNTGLRGRNWGPTTALRGRIYRS
ncbi:MAG: hypothetical protein JOZ63_01140 [Planctomycetaceae bacterium]|nr:hypothetical protein [Planctomycetaceae bacterium]MBV8608484.1 hypothetical protein [Singulisphaera sp.]